MAEKPFSITGPVVTALWMFALVAALEFIAIYQLMPPSPISANAAATEFSSSRAMEHLKVIAQRPHPTGSPENSRVRAYLLSQLTALGLETQVQTTTVVRRDSGLAANVNNIIARLKGSESGRAVMLVTHYDSVPSGPGASDDGSGVVTLLETARALKVCPQLKNDIIFLITDAEELGLVGAKAFIDEHPWVKDVALALNFEARGSCGPSSMFETSPENGRLIRTLSKVVPQAVANSAMYEAYKRMPNDTDFTIFKRAGIAGLNFAYAGCWVRYHTMRDDLINIDEASLQHDGSYALKLARYFGDVQLDQVRATDCIYFSFLGRLLHYSQSWVIPLMVILLILFAAVVWLGFRARQLTLSGILAGLLVWLVPVTLAAAAWHFSWLGLRRTSLVPLLPYGIAYNSESYALGFIAATIAAISLSYALFSRRILAANLFVGALLPWLILMVLTSLFVAGASFMFVWPLLAGLLSLSCLFMRRESLTDTGEAVLWILPAIVAILVFGSTPYMVLMLLSTSGLIPLVLAVGLLIGVLTPHLQIVIAPKRWLVPAGAGIVALGFWGHAVSHRDYSSANPRADSVFYVFDADNGKAVWASADLQPDKWTSQFLTRAPGKANLSEYGMAKVPLLTSQAPAYQFLPAEVTILADQRIGDARALELRVSPRGARVARLRLDNAKVLDASINGRKIDSPSSENVEWRLVCVGFPEEGFKLTLRLAGSATPVLSVVGQHDGLPSLPGRAITPRPDDLMSSPSVPMDSSSLVVKKFPFAIQPRDINR